MWYFVVVSGGGIVVVDLRFVFVWLFYKGRK